MAVPLSALCVLLCCCLLQTQLCTGQSLLGSSRPVVSSVGEDVVLPCLFRPLTDVSALTLEWTRPDLDPRFVFVWRSYEELTVLKNPAFAERATLFTDELKHGNVSLRLTKVRRSDHGTYRCFVPGLGIETSVVLQILVVGSPAVVSVSAVHVWSPAVELQCESGAWYPQPELQWLDSEERPLSADHTLPLPGPDGLFNISSRLTVEHSGSFTCSLSQSSTNSTRQDTVRLTDDSFGVVGRILPVIIALAVALAVSIGLLLIVLFLYLKRKQTKSHYLQQEGQVQDSSKTNIAELEEENAKLKTDLEDSQKKVDKLEKLLEKIHEYRCQKELSEKESATINHFDPWGRGFSLKNKSEEDLNLRDWRVEIEIDDNKPLIFNFESVLTVRPREGQNTVNVWAKGCCPEGVIGYKEKEWENQPPWNTGEMALVSLYDKQELVDRICVRMFLDQPNQ